MERAGKAFLPWGIKRSIRARLTNRIPLDTAANIYPATISRKQHHLYRCTFKLTERMDADILQSALDATAPRFPSFVAKLHTGFFHYALTPVEKAPRLEPEQERMLRHMTKREMKRCCMRVIHNDREIMIECFHALGDGHAALVFLKSLVAEYLEQRYGVFIPASEGVLLRNEPPRACELEDSYIRHEGEVFSARNSLHAYRLNGNVLPDGQIVHTSLTYETAQILQSAHRYQVSVTAYLVAVMILGILRFRVESGNLQRGRQILVSVPVDLRRFFGSRTLRNFSLCATAGVDPAQGEWNIAEICKRVHHQLGCQITQKELRTCITANTRIVQNPFFRVMPLCFKDLMMRIAYRVFGTNAYCLSVSNLGHVVIPDAMQPYVADVGFFLDANPDTPYSCSILSFGNTLHLNFSRCIGGTRLEELYREILEDFGC